jgi:hypothetical protein
MQQVKGVEDRLVHRLVARSLTRAERGLECGGAGIPLTTALAVNLGSP